MLLLLPCSTSSASAGAERACTTTYPARCGSQSAHSWHCFLLLRYTLLHVAAGLGHVRTLGLLLSQLGPRSSLINDSSNDDGATPLHAAAMTGSAAAAQLLLSHGANAGIAGADGTQAWEMVPDAVPAKQQKAAAEGQQQSLQELKRELAEAARKAGRSQAPRSSKVTSRSQVAEGSPAGTTAAAQSPVEAYSEQFRQLSADEQTRKVEGFARLPPTELRDAQHLSPAAKAAIMQVCELGAGVAQLVERACVTPLCCALTSVRAGSMDCELRSRTTSALAVQALLPVALCAGLSQRMVLCACAGEPRQQAAVSLPRCGGAAC